MGSSQVGEEGVDLGDGLLNGTRPVRERFALALQGDAIAAGSH
jgi:hypothetical protein